MNKSPGEGTGPTAHRVFGSIPVGRVPPRGVPGILQQTVRRPYSASPVGDLRLPKNAAATHVTPEVSAPSIDNPTTTPHHRGGVSENRRPLASPMTNVTMHTLQTTPALRESRPYFVEVVAAILCRTTRAHSCRAGDARHVTERTLGVHSNALSLVIFHPYLHPE